MLGLSLGACHDPQPAEPICDDACSCHSIGCPCASAGQCDEGSCSPNSGTCIQLDGGMVFVPAGQFWMGCNPEVDPIGSAFPDASGVPRTCEEELYPATPYRLVDLDAFWIDRTEVTKAQYRVCLEAGFCKPPLQWDAEIEVGLETTPNPDDHPAAGITWSQATSFCAWAGRRLPTEAEWEKAARGRDGRKYPWGDEPEPTCEFANHILSTGASAVSCTDGPKKLLAVGSLPANESVYGALDMTGNVSEWTSEAYDDPGGYDHLPSLNPHQVEGESRVRRGCSYQCPTVGAGGYILRTSMRSLGGPDTTWEFLSQGFRCARDAETDMDQDSATEGLAGRRREM